MNNAKTLWDLDEDTTYNMINPTGSVIAKNVQLGRDGIVDTNGNLVKVPGAARFVETEAGYDDEDETDMPDVNTGFSIRELKKNSIYRTKAGNFFATTSNGLYNFDEKKWAVSKPVARSYGAEKRFKYVGPLGITQADAIRRAG